MLEIGSNQIELSVAFRGRGSSAETTANKMLGAEAPSKSRQPAFQPCCRIRQISVVVVVVDVDAEEEDRRVGVAALFAVAAVGRAA